MRITTTRRISQIFFFLLFVWFCIVATLGGRWWQLRGWPVNWFLQLDPLIALSIWLTTRTIYAGLLWSVATLLLTFLLGRFFCGWVCPLGSAQHLMGYLGGRGAKAARRIERNRPQRAQSLKYLLLLALLAAACAGLFLVPPQGWLAASLQSGLLDPIALISRSFNLVLLPLADAPLKVTAAAPRLYPGAELIGILFAALLLLSLRVPRFYCRFICPLGALFGLLSRFSLLRIARSAPACTACMQCEQHCEGACSPGTVVRTPECVLCLNCLKDCRPDAIVYGVHPVNGGFRDTPDLSRRQVVTALATGLVVVPMLRIGGTQGAAWNPELIRPPGSLAEEQFLARCIKCAQCMRICPTNVIHPAGLQGGWEGLWTPMLDFRSGTSGCQHNCVACSQVCPTAALRPLSVDERMGLGHFAMAGPLRIGTAFLDRGRCLPWAMEIPCIVCQENCPTSPKAIFTREELQPVRGALPAIVKSEGDKVILAGTPLNPGAYAGGDFFVQVDDLPPHAILDNDAGSLTLSPAAAGPSLEQLRGRTPRVLIRLQRPYVDARRCIGCGVCEHECPVQGRRAIRISAENESRQKSHQMVVR